MRAAARLDVGDLLRLPDIADVEDAHAAEALGTDRRVDALRAAVETAARLLDRHEEQVAVDRHVALATRAHDRREQRRLLRRIDVVHVEAVEVAEEEIVLAERDVGVGEVQSGRPLIRLRLRRLLLLLFGLFLFVRRLRLRRLRRNHHAHGALRVREALRLRHVRHQDHVARPRRPRRGSRPSARRADPCSRPRERTPAPARPPEGPPPAAAPARQIAFVAIDLISRAP